MLLQKDLLMLRFSFIQSDYLLAGRNLTILPLEPKLGKMLILGAIFNCLDPVQTVVTGLSVRDHFLMPLDKKDVS
jgi:ATP-dependent RNA helicase DHX36